LAEPTLLIRTCPKCGEDRVARGRAVNMEEGGSSQEVCDVCALPGTKQKVADKGQKIRKELQKLPFLDLTAGQKLLEEAELYLEDAEENLPGNWQEVAGNLLMARRRVDYAYDKVREDAVPALLELAEQNLEKAGHVQSKERRKKEREEEQAKFDKDRSGVETNIKVGRQSFEDSQNRDLTQLRGTDRRKLLGDARRQAARAYFGSQAYLEHKTEVDVGSIVEKALGADEEEEGGEEITSNDGSAPVVEEAPGPSEEEAVEEAAAEEEVEEET